MRKILSPLVLAAAAGAIVLFGPIIFIVFYNAGTCMKIHSNPLLISKKLLKV
jgi:hypothetical protein